MTQRKRGHRPHGTPADTIPPPSQKLAKESRKRASKVAERPRNAAATREAILQSAMASFSRAGYDSVGVREIAESAGVTAVLINRYFGSKEELFAAVVEQAFSSGTLLSGDGTKALARDIAKSIVAKTAPGSERIDPLMLMLLSASHPRAAAILRDGIERHFGQPLAEALTGTHADERAALVLSVIAGVQLMRKVIGNEALARVNAKRLADTLEALFRVVIDPDMPARE